MKQADHILDAMIEDDYPTDLLTRWAHAAIERRAIKYGAHFLFTARSTLQMYLDRYPTLNPAKCLVIPNGFDERDFESLTFSSRPRG